MYLQCLILQWFHCLDVFFYLCLFLCAFSRDTAVFWLFSFFLLSHNINLTNKVKILKDIVIYLQCLILQWFHCLDVFFYLCLFLCAFSWDTAVFGLFSFFLLSHNINLKNKVNNIIRYGYIPSVFDFAMISLFGCVFLFVSVFVRIQLGYCCFLTFFIFLLSHNINLTT